MKALDLFCCDGGASLGLSRAGFDDIVGIDIVPHPDYPFEFVRGDATTPPVDLTGFDFIWASPPCQMFSDATRSSWDKQVNLIPQTRELLIKSGKPYVIENVPRAPIRKDLLLCGSMFGLDTYRHRHFECSFPIRQPTHLKHFKKFENAEVVCVVGSSPMAPGCFGDRERRKRVRAKLNERVKNSGGVLKLYQDVMDMHHSKTPKYISEAIPPCYSEYIGKEFLRGVE